MQSQVIEFMKLWFGMIDTTQFWTKISLYIYRFNEWLASDSIAYPLKKFSLRLLSPEKPIL